MARPSRSDILARWQAIGHAVAVFHLAQRALAGSHGTQPVPLVHQHGIFAAGAVAGIRLHSAFGSLNPRRRLDVRVDRAADGLAQEARVCR